MSPRELLEEQNRQTAELAKLEDGFDDLIAGKATGDELDACMAGRFGTEPPPIDERRFADLVQNAGRDPEEFPPATERRPRPTLLEQCPKNLKEAFSFLDRCRETRPADDPELLELAAHVRAAGYVGLAELDRRAAQLSLGACERVCNPPRKA